MFVCAQVYLVPESPRWYMLRNKYDKAFRSLCRLRKSKLQAARDLYSIHAFLQVELKLREGKNLWKEFFAVPRNRRAAQSSFFVMFMQQFCGVNVIAYYSSAIFTQAGLGQREALIGSLGTGIINWIFAIPAIYTIDTFGRRNLLLVGYPLMGLCLLWTGMSFFIPEESVGRIASVATGIYMFMVMYSPSSGPVPFTYSAEAFPLYVREIGMSFATAVCWGFNFILSLTWPALVEAFKPQGAFGWYAAWNFMACVACYFFLPETKALTLEELDQVFSVPTRVHAKHYMDMLPWYLKKNVLRQDVPPKKELYQLE
jgi:sugar porter (SP) family MFS transporter